MAVQNCIGDAFRGATWVALHNGGGCGWWVGDHPYITSAYKLGGWVQKMSIFADVQYCIYADLECGWVRKGLKLYWRNIWMVFYIKLVSCQCLESQVTVCLNTQWCENNNSRCILICVHTPFCDNAHSEMISTHCLSPCYYTSGFPNSKRTQKNFDL